MARDPEIVLVPAGQAGNRRHLAWLVGGSHRGLMHFSRSRAIIIRNGEVIPMSSEFTPETERQRLQYLVRVTWSGRG